MTDEGGARFSLPAGEGAGAMLGLAAGDAAGGAHEGAYSACTQQAIVVAYHLFEHGEVERESLTVELAELDGDDREAGVYRSIGEDMRAWLDSLGTDDIRYGTSPSIDPAIRAVPLGVWYRRQPDELITAVLEASRVTHLDATSAVLAAAVAAAVAGASFAQNGHDLLMATNEVVRQAAAAVEADAIRYSGADRLGEVVSELGRTPALIGGPWEELPLGEQADAATAMVVTALAATAPISDDPHAVVGQMAKLGGSPLGAVAGAILGARLGVRSWPWPFPNDTWFVAVGERLVAGRQDLADLPIPYAVEQRVTYSPRYQQL